MSLQNYTIEQATNKDIKEISKIISVYLGSMNFEPYDGTSSSFQTIEKINEDAVADVLERTLIARIPSGRIIGVCALAENKKGDYFKIGLDHYDEVAVLVVDKEFRKQNIGYNLLKAIMLKTSKNIVFEAWGDTGAEANAHFVLVKSGFKHIKRLPNFYKQRGDCPLCVHRNKCNEALCTCDIYAKINLSDDKN